MWAEKQGGLSQRRQVNQNSKEIAEQGKGGGQREEQYFTCEKSPRRFVDVNPTVFQEWDVVAK